jgi:hypothetical protein
MSMFEVVILKLNFAIIYMEKLLVEYFFPYATFPFPCIYPPRNYMICFSSVILLT